MVPVSSGKDSWSVEEGRLVVFPILNPPSHLPPRPIPLGPTGISAFPLGWPWEAQSSPRVARESWGLRSSHCRAKETSSRLVSRT